MRQIWCKLDPHKSEQLSEFMIRLMGGKALMPGRSIPATFKTILLKSVPTSTTHQNIRTAVA